jgi:4-hydroxy-tetrahydrodipicolinate synthase
MFRGSYTAVVTPMKDGVPDLDKLGELIERQIAAGTDGIVPVGTTGESATLSHDEHHAVVEYTIKTVAGRVKVVAGAGSNSTSEAVGLTRAAEAAGADGTLSISPYYNKPSAEGMYRHFKAVAGSTKLPVIIYNVPSRTGKEIAIETVGRLAEIPNIVAIKEAGGSVDRASKLVGIKGIDVISGDDSLTLPMIAVGAVGVISVTSNVVPKEMRDMVHAALEERLADARELHHRMLPLMNELFRENNPAGAKTALKLMGLINGEMRPPLCELEPENEKALEKVLQDLGLVS